MKTRGEETMGRSEVDKRRAESEGMCSRAGFVNAADLEVYNEQDEKPESIVGNVVSIVEACQDIELAEMLTKEDYFENTGDG